MKTRAILFFLLLCLIGSGPAFSAPAPTVMIDVPFVAQSPDGCGSAAISMVMRYWETRSSRASGARGNTADPQHIQSALYSGAAHGIPASKMKDYLVESGYRAVAFEGNWEDLRHQVQEGRPLIVALQASGKLGPFHYVVVTGIDADREFVYVHDPAQQQSLRMSRSGFESEWKPLHNWTLLAVPQSAD